MITIKKVAGRIVVTGYGNSYSVPAHDMAIKEDGTPAGVTWAQALAAGNLYAYDDNVHGNSHGLHGQLFATGYGPVLA